MDIYPDDSPATVLPYDDPIQADETDLIASTSFDPSDSGRSLADRIGHTKVYLLSDASKSRSGKRRRDEDDEDAPKDEEMNEGESLYRENAILLHGTPISHLPTSNIFAYATHFDAHPLGLEWVDDTTCVLVFDSKTDARTAFRFLQKSLAEEPAVDDNSVTAKPIPVPIWPAEDRINAALDKSEGLKGILRMRWARADDIKKKGAKKQSEFYRKYGRDAGKTFEEGPPPPKRRRPQESITDAVTRAQLDEELDNFLAEDEDAPPPSPPSKMRSDYIGTDGRTLLERTSAMRAHSDDNSLASRLTSPLSRRARTRRDGEDVSWEGEEKPVLHDRLSEPGSRYGRGNRDRTRGRRPPRQRATQEDLDAELDAFLAEKD
ncbi:hypothetical protein GSI_00403 [Ganoderma sinense ZZ0214-1]|uniref:Chromatin target of PRMT1 protein C-terminal domain-containing protein n=1 Tax=Ganoderma sinense ZZ0214-1 TaxID=1077348 RepID=A0A2G8SSI6_9APHY|nr:hypothetical protein GSI_00403 [Ganoderma sinense ZZ0214-1]